MAALWALLAVLPIRAQGPASGDNALFDTLVNKGIAIPHGPTVKLPAPLIAPGQSPNAQQLAAIMEKAAGNVPVELFIKSSVTAPHSYDIESVDSSKGERCAQLVSLRFIAYGNVKAAEKADAFRTLISANDKRGDGKQDTELSDKDLQARGITPPKRRAEETYRSIAMPLLNKVQVEGVMRSVNTVLPRAALYASMMDPRFENDMELPNRWYHVDPQAGGQKKGPSHPYSGIAGYVAVTELPEPKGAMLIEMHLLIHEPREWFDGLNLLRSKLPILLRDNVRSFRQRLKQQGD